MRLKAWYADQRDLKHEAIESVSMDIWPAIGKAIREIRPDEPQKVAVDRFLVAEPWRGRWQCAPLILSLMVDYGAHGAPDTSTFCQIEPSV